MPVTVKKLLLWRSEVENKPGVLAGVLQPLSTAGADLQVVPYTTDVLSRDFWLRPDLAPRDRSPVTVSALTACGQSTPIPYQSHKIANTAALTFRASERPLWSSRNAAGFCGQARALSESF